MSSNKCTEFKRLRGCRAVPIEWGREREVQSVGRLDLDGLSESQ